MPKQIKPNNTKFILNYLQTQMYVNGWYYDRNNQFTIKMGSKQNAYIFQNEDSIPLEINSRLNCRIYFKEFIS